MNHTTEEIERILADLHGLARRETTYQIETLENVMRDLWLLAAGWPEITDALTHTLSQVRDMIERECM